MMIKTFIAQYVSKTIMKKLTISQNELFS